MAQSKKNNKRLTRQEKYMQKKVELSEQLYDKICVDKKYKKKYLTKVLQTYGKKLAKLELAQNGVHRPMLFFDIPNKKPGAPNGSATFRGKIPGFSAISLNYDRVVSNIRNTNSERDKAVILTNFAQTVLHECTHIEQHEVCEKSKKIDSFVPEDVYKYSLEFLAKDTLGNQYYKKGDNYWKMLFEKNAREEGFAKSLDILSKLITPDEMNYFYENKKMDDILNDAYLEPEELSDQNGELKDRYTLNNRIAAHAIKQNPKLLNKYPILKKAFNKDGSRKHLYQTIKENARAEKMIKLNPFISSAKKKEKLTQVNDLYSEIFSQSFDFVDRKEIDKTCKVVGKVAFNAMIDKVEVHENNSLKQLVKDIETEKMIREKFNFDSVSINNIYYQRMEYAKHVEKDNAKAFTYLRNGIASNPHKKLSTINAKKIIDKDKEIVKNNLKSNNPASRSTSKNLETKQTYSSYEMVGDLDQMRDLKQQYKSLEDSRVQKRDAMRESYDDLSKSINEKEKNNGIKY